MAVNKPYRLGTYGYILDSSKRLLLVQHNSYRDNEWSLPGGGRKNGEDALQNIYRELSEELGIHEQDLTLVGVSKQAIQYDFPGEMLRNNDPMAAKYAGQRKDQVVFTCHASLEESIVMDQSELKSHMLCPLDKLDSYLLFPGQAQEARRVLAEFNIV